MSIKITYFVHGTTTDNEKDLCTGWMPGQLSELGVEQAKNLGKIVANKKFDAFFCSDLKRAFNSAQLGFGDKYKIIKDKRLRECNYGDFNRTAEEKIDYKKYIDMPFPNGENLKDVGKRIQDFLNFLKGSYNNKHIAILSHKAPQLALEVLLKGKTWEQAIRQDWRNTKSWQPGWEYEINN